MRYILVALLITLAGCGVSISPVPGVGIYIPLPGEIGHNDSDKKGHNHDDHRERD